jgi:hypothetical protein
MGVDIAMAHDQKKKRLMGALARMPTEPHSEMKIGKRKPKSEKSLTS